MSERLPALKTYVITGIALVFVSAAILTAYFSLLAHERVFEDYQNANWAMGSAEREFHNFYTTYLRYMNEAEPATKSELLEAYNSFQKRFELMIGTSKSNPYANHKSAVSDYMARILVDLTELEKKILQLDHSATAREKEILEPIESMKFLFEWISTHSLTSDIRTYDNLKSTQLKPSLLLHLLITIVSGAGLIIILLRQAKTAQHYAVRAGEAEQRASGAKTRLVEALESISEGFLLLDKTGHIVLANSKLKDYYDTVREEIIPGAKYADILRNSARRGQYVFNRKSQTPDDYTLMRLARMLAPQGPFEQRLSNGRVLLINEELTPEGGVVSTQRDISALKKAEDLLELRLTALEASVDGIGIINKDGIYSYVNKSYAELNGFKSPEDLTGMVWDAHYQENIRQMIANNIMPALDKGGRWQGELTFRYDDNNPEEQTQELSLARLASGGMICIARDITGRKNAEKQQDKLRQQLFQAQKLEAIGRLAGGIAHDFNNILAAISGYAEFLEEDLEEGSEPQHFAQQILAGGEKAKMLVDQILTFSRRTEADRRPENLSRITHDVISLLRASLPKTICIETLIETDQATIQANENQLHQVLMNLVVNAKDAMPDNKGTLKIELFEINSQSDYARGIDTLAEFPGQGETTKISIIPVSDTKTVLTAGSLAQNHDYACLGISDTGTGMTHAIMMNIFEPFFTTKDVNKGTGLGLAMVHGILASHQAALRIESDVGKGTRFDLFFPLTTCQPTNDAIAQKFADITGTERILIVDDEQAVSAVIAKGLERLGYQACRCDSPLEALEILKNSDNLFDLIISDYTMPHMTGLEMADIISRDYPDLPMVLISGYSETKLKKAGQHPAIYAALKKPVNGNTLARHVRKILDEA